MKKQFFIKAFAVVALLASSVLESNAQTVNLKAGTIIPLKSTATVLARDVNVGNKVDFIVSKDILVDGKVAIARGTQAFGKVTMSEKSSIAGTKGKLNISISYLLDPNSGEQIYLSNGELHFEGNNRTPLAVITGLFVLPCILIPGTKAYMPEGYECMPIVSSNTTITIK